MGPRPRGRGIPPISIPAVTAAVLQWGRDRAVAELRSSRLAVAHESMLQWGRDRAVAELKKQKTGPLLKSPLQWGRDRAVAELQ